MHTFQTIRRQRMDISSSANQLMLFTIHAVHIFQFRLEGPCEANSLVSVPCAVPET